METEEKFSWTRETKDPYYSVLNTEVKLGIITVTGKLEGIRDESVFWVLPIKRRERGLGRGGPNRRIKFKRPSLVPRGYTTRNPTSGEVCV